MNTSRIEIYGTKRMMYLGRAAVTERRAALIRRTGPDVFLTWGTSPTCLQPKGHVGNVPHDTRARRERVSSEGDQTPPKREGRGVRENVG
jgi:hypothetical protein